MSVAEMPRLTTKEKIKWFILLAIIAILAIIPCGPTYTFQVKEFFIIAIAGIYMMAVELVPVYIAAILMPVAYWLLNVAPATVVFGAWTQEVPWVLLGSLFVAVIMNKTGLSKRLAYGLMLVGRGNFYVVCIMLVVAGAILASFIPAATARAALFGSIALSLTNAMGWEKNKKHAILLFSCITMVATGTSYMVMTGTNSSLVVAGVLESAGFPITWAQWALYCVVPGVIEVVIVLLILFFAFRKYDTGSTKEMDSKTMHAYIKEQYKTLGTPNRQEKKAIALFIIILLLLLTSKYHSLTPGKVFMLMSMIAFLPGVNLLNAKEGKNVDYSMVFLVTSCVAIGDVANELGLGQTFVETITPMLPHSIFGIAAVVYLICFLGNMLMTPVALGSAFALPIINIALSMDMNPFGITLLWWTACAATVFPYENTGDLLVFSYGQMSMKNWIIVGIIRSGVLFFGRFILYIPWFTLMGIL